MPNESFEYEASPASAERSKTPETELKELKETVGLLQNSLASVSAALGQVDRRLAGINSLRPNKTEAAPSFETDLDALDADGLMRLIEEHTDGMTERGKAYARDLLVYFRALQESSPEEILTNWVDGDCYSDRLAVRNFTPTLLMRAARPGSPVDRVAISAMQRLQEAVLDVLADKGLQLLAPDQYEPFDPQRHDSHDRDIVWTNEEAHHNQVEQIIWPGLEGSGVIKKARVRRFLDIKRERG